MKMTGRTILITGGTSGIGLGMARALVARGNRVAITGRDAAKLAEAERAIPEVVTIRSDVGDAADVAALFDDVLGRLPDLDVLINNAGVMRNLKLGQERPLDDVTREVEINLNGPIRMVQKFLPHLRARPVALIVNVSSALAFVPMAIAPVYCATKAALHAYTLSLRAQLADTSVAVVELAPPEVETALLRGEFAKETEGRKAMAVEDLVARALRGIEGGALEIRPGQSNALKIMGRIAPTFMVRQLAKVGPASAGA